MVPEGAGHGTGLAVGLFLLSLLVFIFVWYFLFPYMQRKYSEVLVSHTRSVGSFH